MSELSPQDLQDLREAKERLEHPGLAARLADTLGRPLESGFKLLPDNWYDRLGGLTESALMRSLDLSLATLGKSRLGRSHNLVHRIVVTGSGAAAGMFGLGSLAVELPFSTVMILRSIAEIAREEGFNLTHPTVKLACLEVLAFGGCSRGDDASKSGYWMVRGALAHSLSEASSHIARKGLTKESGPALARLISLIASQFGSVVTEAAAARAIPVIGAVSSGTVNYLFMRHFQEMAKGHFVIRRLEAIYGSATVERAYRSL
jgi:hypothetical protein